MPRNATELKIDLSQVRPADLTCVSFMKAKAVKLGKPYSQKGLTFTVLEGRDLEIRTYPGPGSVKNVAPGTYLTCVGFLEIKFPAPATWVEISAAKIPDTDPDIDLGHRIPSHPEWALRAWVLNAKIKESIAQCAPPQDPDGLVRTYAFSSSQPAWAPGPVTENLGPIETAIILGAPGLLLYQVCYR